MSDFYDALVVGAGPAGSQVALGLAATGFSGTVGLLGAESGLPYERPPLSKSYLLRQTDDADLLLRPDAYWAKSPIDVIGGSTVCEVDSEGHRVRTTEGAVYAYGKLVWAAGCRPRQISIPGADLAGVQMLRNIGDARDLRDRLSTCRRAVVIGGGYIGLEVAASARKLGVAVTVIETRERLLSRVSGVQVADFVRSIHHAAGVRIEVGAEVVEIVGNAGSCTGVRLASGELLDADVVVVGIGVIPNVEPLTAAKAETPNGVRVDDCCRTSIPDILAVGDCALLSTPGHSSPRLESIPNAATHAKIAVATLTGTPPPPRPVPWFWSDQYDCKIKTAGVLGNYDREILRGASADGHFSVVYLAEGVVAAVDTVNSPKDFAQAKRLVGKSVNGQLDDLADPSVPLQHVVQALAV